MRTSILSSRSRIGCFRVRCGRSRRARPTDIASGGTATAPATGTAPSRAATAAASVAGGRFDGVNLFPADPHISIDSTDDALKRLSERIRSRGFVAGSLVAPVWPATGGGSAMGGDEDRKN